MPLAAALALALLGLLVGAAIGHLSPRRRPREPDLPPQPVAMPAPAATPEHTLAKLRHDIRGALSPAMLTADRLSMSGDPAVVRSAEIMLDAIERVAALLDANRKQEVSPIAPTGSPDLNSGQR